MNASTHTSLAALKRPAHVRRIRRRVRASATAGNAASSSGKNSQLTRRSSRTGAGGLGDAFGPGDAERDRQLHVRRRGLRNRRAVDELDHRVDHRLGVHDDLDAVEVDAEQQMRLDDLKALVDQGRRVVVMTGPMSQVGCASACSGVTSASSARVRPRNGPPLAVRISRRTSSARSPRRHWASAECSESTGTIWPGLAGRRDELSADDQRLLVGQRQRRPGLERGERRRAARPRRSCR